MKELTPLFNDFLTSGWVTAAGLLLTVLFSFYVIKRAFQAKLHIRKRKNYPFAIEIFFKTKLFFLAALTLYLCSPLLPEELTPFISTLTFIATTIQVAIWINYLLIHFINTIEFKGEAWKGIPTASKNLLQILGQGTVWVITFLFLLDNLNFDVATLLAGLGIGGIAVALAVQNILGDVLASLSIIIDKPFMVGDFIILDNYMGTVQYIGIKTTRLRSLSGEQIILSNSDLLKSRLRNFKRMDERRVVFEIQIPFETPAKQLEDIPILIKEIIESTEDTRFDRAHFKKIDTYAFNFEVVYYILSRDYTLYMDIQQKINFQLLKMLSEKGIDFAYPTQRKL